ncbi:MAG TPA: hypothetical protein VHC97_04910 [Thermoanaerobaculia bacterium]|jgi:hypothetical protein|nr:hypothetical protein [Thermoanaerobaculia bacterium]
MHERLRSFFPLLFLVLFAASTARATTVAPPSDLGHLARTSDAVVFAQAIESRVEEDESLPYTVTRFQALRPVAGADPGLIFEVREPGGSGRRRAAAVAGAPRYQEGHNYLLFLDRTQEGRWRSKMMSYGLLEEVSGTGLLRPLPEAGRIEVLTRKSYEPVGVYRKGALLDHLRDVRRGAAWNGRQVAAPDAEAAAVELKGEALAASGVAGDALTAPSGCVFLFHEADGLPIRWFGYETGAATSTVIATTPGQTGIADGGVSAVQAGVAAWANHPDAVMRFTFGGTRARNISCSGNFDYDDGAVVFNDPCSDIADLSSNCAGTLAFGGALYDPTSTKPYDGSQWHPALSTFAIINNGAQCVGETNFKEVLAHELGHAQGFGHHNPSNPYDALMSASLKGGGLGANLRTTDKVCADFAYHTFLDVPYSRWSWSYVEAIENARIDTGCGNANYCPDQQVNRASMAVFLVRGKHGGTFVPPAATGTVFADVPASHPQAAYIEQLYRDGMTSGCGTNPQRYCPSDVVSRAQMATFLIRVGHGSAYTPPPASGTVFQDVPTTHWAAPFIEQLYSEGGTAGCATNPLRYCPETLLTREEISAFLVRAYNLPLP